MSTSRRTPKRSLLTRGLLGTAAVGVLLGAAYISSQGVGGINTDLSGLTVTHTGGAASAVSDTATNHAAASPNVGNYCDSSDDTRDGPSLLPATRWSDFQLSFIDQAKVLKITAFVSSISSWIFYLAALLWSILMNFLEVGLNFKPLCSIAGPVNELAAIVGRYAFFFFIPLIILALWYGRKHFLTQNIAKGLTSLVVLTIAFGGTYYVTQQSNEAQQAHGSDAQAIIESEGTVPWMLAGATQFFSGMNDAITNGLGGLTVSTSSNEAKDADAQPAFYDGASKNNELTCYAYDAGLKQLYSDQVEAAGIANASGMLTMNDLWERGFLAPWISAQFGTGKSGADSDGGNEYPAQVACRVLEQRTEGDELNKAQTFIDVYNSQEIQTQTDDAQLIVDSGQVYLFHPGIGGDAKTYVPFAWAFCGDFHDGRWNATKAAEGMKRGDDTSCTNDDEHHGGTILGKELKPAENEDGPLEAADEMIDNKSTNVHNFGGTDDAAKDRIGNGADQKTLREWAQNYWGSNQGQRVTSALLAVITSVLYLWSFGPAALGLLIAGVAMIVLGTLLALWLTLWGLGREAGKRMLLLTGATTMATFLFTLVLSFLASIVTLLTQVILAVTGGGPSMLRQMLLAATPVVAMFIMRAALKKLGLPNMTSLAGSLGMATGLAAKTAGEQKLTGTTTALGDRFSRKGRAGAKAARERDPHAMQRGMMGRLRSNALAKKLGQSKAGTAVANLANAAKDTLGHGKDVVGNNLNRLPGVKRGREIAGNLAKTKSGKIAAATLAMAAIGGAAPVALLGVGAAGALAGSGERKLGKMLDGKLNPARLSSSAARKRAMYAAKNLSVEDLAQLDPNYERAQLAGVVSTQNAVGASKDAQKFRHYLNKIQDPQERKQLLMQYVNGQFDTLRAVQNGANSPSGLNSAFEGFSSILAQADAQSELATKLGLPETGVMVSSHGLSAPAPLPLGSNGAPKLPVGSSLEVAAHPFHYLDSVTLKRQENEDDDAYVSRLYGSALARGLVDSEGKTVDVFAARGIDIKTAEGAERVESWIQGNQDDVLDSLRFEPAKGEHKVVTQALEWSNRNSADMMDAQYEQVKQAQILQEDVLNTLRNPGSVVVKEVPLESGGFATQDLQSVHSRLSEELTDLSGQFTGCDADDAPELAREIGDVNHIKSMASEVIDGLETAAMSRAAVQVQQLSLERRGDVGPKELRNMSADALRAAREDSQKRRNFLDKSVSDLAKWSASMRNAPSEDSRSVAMTRAQETLERLNFDLAETRKAEVKASQDALAAFEEAREKELERQREEEAAGMVRFSPRHAPATSNAIAQKRTSGFGKFR